MNLKQKLARIQWIGENILDGYDPADSEKFWSEIKWLCSKLRILALGDYECPKGVFEVKPEPGQRFKNQYYENLALADTTLSIRSKQKYLLWASTIAEFGMLSTEIARAMDCRDWLGKALVDIGNGRDIEDALNIKPKPSERKNLWLEDLRSFRDEMLVALLYTHMLPEDQGGYNTTLEEACAVYAGDHSLRKLLGISEDSVTLVSNLQVTEDYLRKIWNTKTEIREAIKKSRGLFK